MESDVRGRMQPLREQLTETMNHLHTVFETHVFVALCRGYWDRMGQVDHAQNIDADCCSFLMIEIIRFVSSMTQDVLSFLENRKENRSWYKGSRITVSVSRKILRFLIWQCLIE